MTDKEKVVIPTMTPDQILDSIDLDEGVIEYGSESDALIGTAIPWIGGTRPTVLVYSRAKLIEIYMNRDGMTYEEASRHIDFNTNGGYLGPHTPIVVDDCF